MNEKETRRLLRQWDPAAGAETPSAELHAGLRARLAAEASPERRAGRLAGRLAVAAAAVAATLLVAVTMLRPERLGESSAAAGRTTAAPGAVGSTKSIDAGGDDVRVVYTASNGVRIYWTVPAAPASRL